MKIEYVGPFDEVEVEGFRCKRGESIEVSASQGKRLLMQEGNWKLAKSSDKRTKE